MSTQMTEKEYDNLYNEDGEGYNPIRAKREQAEFDASQKLAKKLALTPQGKIDALYRRIEFECGSVARELGNDAEINALQADLYAQINATKADMDAEFMEIWTLEETKARRIDWNSRVKAGEFGTPGSKRVNFKALDARVKAQGWSLDDLNRAIKLHNL